MQLADLVVRNVDASDPAARDPEFIRTVALPFFDALRVHYFRAEIDGTENIPRDRPFIAVANHNGGPLLPDCWVLAAYWWSLLGVERPAYAMVHDAALGIPLLRTLLVKMGGLRASRENAQKVLHLGASLLIYPGGELDCLKSFWRRHTIDFHGRTGFVRLALEHGVPILPVVDVGGHEVYFTLLSSERGPAVGRVDDGLPSLPAAAREVRVPRRRADRAGPRSRRGPGRARRTQRLRAGARDHAGDAGRPRPAAAAAGLRLRGSTSRR